MYFNSHPGTVQYIGDFTIEPSSYDESKGVFRQSPADFAASVSAIHAHHPEINYPIAMQCVRQSRDTPAACMEAVGGN